ncbi:MAG: L-threonylcarbamoyladenylate synthase [Mycoplasmatota bacterium]|nr:L-threonylcarbamoyladenylate synthase [Mycoplasmatota bacterium]
MNVSKICEVLENGGLVVTPTDTVYGIMGDALNLEAVKKVYEAKHRAYNKPLILLMDSYEMIKEYTLDISEEEDRIMREFFPGLLTIILKKNNKIDDLISGGMDTVGIRIPGNEDLIRIIKKLGRPIFSTSANISDEEVITSIDKLDRRLLKYIDYVEDGGEIVAASSTIVKVDNKEMKILRSGILADKVLNIK